MRFPFERELIAERHRLLATLDELPDHTFEAGRTLCDEWSPRDVLAHLLAVDHPVSAYLPYGPYLHAANKAQVEGARRLSRSALMQKARQWARRPSLSSRCNALVVLGDLAIHHRDIIRGLGMDGDASGSVATFVLWDGALLSSWTNLRILRYRIVPTDGYPALGRPGAPRGTEVHGTREALGLWLAGRDAVTGELRFTAPSPSPGRSHDGTGTATRRAPGARPAQNRRESTWTTDG